MGQWTWIRWSVSSTRSVGTPVDVTEESVRCDETNSSKFTQKQDGVLTTEGPLTKHFENSELLPCCHARTIPKPMIPKWKLDLMLTPTWRLGGKSGCYTWKKRCASTIHLPSTVCISSTIYHLAQSTCMWSLHLRSSSIIRKWSVLRLRTVSHSGVWISSLSTTFIPPL